MPFDLQTKLEIVRTDPNLVTWVFNGGPEPEDIYLYQRFGGDFFRYEEMLIDPQVGGKLDERVGALLGRAVLVDAASEEKADIEAANLAKKILDIHDEDQKQGKKDKKKRPLIPYEQICSNFLNSGLLIGFAVQALEWVERDKLILPNVEFVPQRRFTFRYREPDNKTIKVCTDEDLDPTKDIVLVSGYELRLLTKRSPIEGERCPRNRFICYTYGSMKGLPQGLGLGYRIRKFYEIRKEVIKSGVLTGDRLGSPPVHGTYPVDLNPQNTDDAIVLGAFNRLLKAISPNANASTTDGFKINFLEPRAGGHQILKWLYDTAAVEISRAIWGEGSYSEKTTGSYAAETQQAENRNENVVDADCNSLDEGPCAQLWQLIGEYNWPDATNPIIRRETRSEIRRLEQERLEDEQREAKRNGRVQSDRTLILDIGLNVTNDYIKATYGEAFSLPDAEPPPEEDTAELSESASRQGSMTADFGAIIDRKLKWNGLDIGVEFLPGAVRFPGRKNSKKLRSGYGHIRGYLGADGNALDCYLYLGLVPPKGEEPQGSDRIFEVEQISPEDGDFNEHKYMIGYDSVEAAKAAYLTEMPEEYFGRIREVTVADLEQYKRVNFAESVLWGVWFKGRNTPAVVDASDRGEAIKKARATKCAGWNQDVTSCRQLKGKSLELAKKGNWVRERANGSEECGAFKYRPQLKPEHSEGDDSFFLTSEDAYEERFTDAFHQALKKAIASIKDSLTPELSWESLYAKLDITTLASAIAEGNSLSFLVGMYSERPDRGEVEFADDPTRLPFDKAIAYFRQKLNIPTQTWKDIQGAENDWAFAVAGVTSAEMLQDFRAAMDRYIAEGTGFAQFAKEFDAIAQNYGWQPREGVARRADLVAKTNFRMAYAAGQWQQRQDPVVKQLRPGLMWRHRDSPQERPHHKAMDGMVFDGNDPQYSGLVGFSGFGCRCRTFSVPAPDGGFDVLSDRLPYQFPNGEMGEVPAIKVKEKIYPVADEGFFYTPGKSPISARPHLFQQMLERQQPTWQKLIRKVIPQRILRAFKPKGFG
jgi:hypothetical protein